MAEITAALVKELREITGAGMMDCKKSLVATSGDLEAAIDSLRQQGLAAAANKAGRVAAEGLVGVFADGTRGAVVEVNSETDFVSRNEAFQSFVASAVRLALDSGGDLEQLTAANYPGGDETVAEHLVGLIGRIGENLTLRRVGCVTVSDGIVATYVHNQAAPGLGRIGVLVALESTGERGALNSFGRQLAMHVAAAAPQAVARDQIDPATLAREKRVLREQARESGKPDHVIESIVEGRLRKFYEECCLLDQTFVIDGESKVGQVVERLAADLGAAVAVAGFVRFRLGEGVERKKSDFAAEVAAQLG